MAQAQVDNFKKQIDNMVDFDEVSDRFYDVIDANITWVQKPYGKGVKFITTANGDWKTKCRGFLIKYNDLLLALSLDDVIDGNIFQESIVPTHHDAGVRVIKSKSLNFDSYSSFMSADYDFVNDIAEDSKENEYSKGALVRNKHIKLNELQQPAIGEQEQTSNYPMTQRLQPTEASLHTPMLSESDHPILRSLLLDNPSQSIKQKRKRRKRRRKNKLNNTSDATSVKKQLFPPSQVYPSDNSPTLPPPETPLNVIDVPECGTGNIDLSDFTNIDPDVEYPSMPDIGAIMKECGLGDFAV